MIIVYIQTLLLIIFIVIYDKLWNNSNTKDNRTNIILTLSLYYKIEILKWFFESLQCHSSDSDLIIFTDKRTWIEINKHYPNRRYYGIILTDTYPFYPSNDSRFPINMNDIKKYIPTNYNKEWKFFYATVRYFLFNIWLKYYGSAFSKILITDSRDMLFQSDPFNWIKESAVYLQAELYKRNGKSGIIADEYNSKWINPFHPSQNIMSHQIINAGQMLGTSFEICSFINEFTTFLLKSKIIANDQASLNYFYYTHSFNYKVYVHGFKQGYTYIFMIVKKYFPNSFYQPVNNYILNKDNTIPPMLHGLDKIIFDTVIKYHTNYCNKESEYNNNIYRRLLHTT